MGEAAGVGVGTEDAEGKRGAGGEGEVGRGEKEKGGEEGGGLWVEGEGRAERERTALRWGEFDGGVGGGGGEEEVEGL